MGDLALLAGYKGGEELGKAKLCQRRAWNARRHASPRSTQNLISRYVCTWSRAIGVDTELATCLPTKTLPLSLPVPSHLCTPVLHHSATGYLTAYSSAKRWKASPGSRRVLIFRARNSGQRIVLVSAGQLFAPFAFVGSWDSVFGTFLLAPRGPSQPEVTPWISHPIAC